jgi:aspartyl-tRNA(Asn)/glutamyl-tRNA(Gln) amidotransferase subunit A
LISDLELSGLSIAHAAELIRSGEVSPLELASAYLERVERLDATLHAFITVSAERALDDAHRATAELARGVYRGSLHGIPIALKDLFDTAGIATTAGSKIYAERVPDSDAAVVRKLRTAGVILLGKTNLDELAFGGPDNPHFPPSQNPWDLERVPGGSSGGSAVAIAGALAAGALGTDTAGSIRLPASFCGVVGLKPTYGRVSAAGVIPLSPSFDHVGPIARTVEDAALLLGAIAGYDVSDATTQPMPVPDYAAALTTDLQGLRVSVLRPHFFDLLEEDVRSAVEAAIGVLRGLGAEVQDDDTPLPLDGARGLGTWIMTEAGAYHAEAVRHHTQDFGRDVLENLTQEPVDGRTLVKQLWSIRELAAELRRRLEVVDVLITPSTPIAAPKRGQDVIALGGEQVDVRRAFVRCLSPFSATHLPALSVPCGFSAAGLPVGLQIIGKPFDELTVLRAGHAYEQATDWRIRRPPLD